MDENGLQQNSREGLKTIRTYMSDMAETVRENQASVAKIALAEQKRRERDEEYKKAGGSPFKKFLFTLGGLVLVGGAIYGTIFILNKKEQSNSAILPVKEESIIAHDLISRIELGERDDLLVKVKEAVVEPTDSVKNILIKFILPTKLVNGIQEKLSTSALFKSLGFTAPYSLVRSLSDSYMIGTYTKKDTMSSEKTVSPFIILQTKDYSLSYAGMLEWEKTMASNFVDIFNLKTKLNRLEMSDMIFKDVLVKNKDVRALYNENEEPILYYLFTDKTNILITDNTDAIAEVISRLIIKNIKPL